MRADAEAFPLFLITLCICSLLKSLPIISSWLRENLIRGWGWNVFTRWSYATDPLGVCPLHLKTTPENVSLNLCYEMASSMPISWVKKSSLMCGLDVVQIHFQKVTDASHDEYLTYVVGTQQSFNSEFSKEQALHEAHTWCCAKLSNLSWFLQNLLFPSSQIVKILGHWVFRLYSLVLFLTSSSDS